MKRWFIIFISLVFVATLAGCGKHSAVGGKAGDATTATVKFNDNVAKSLKLDDPQRMEDAMRDFIARPSGKITTKAGEVLFDFDEFKFVEGKPPLTVSPSLWQHAILNDPIGLLKVTEGIYQLRGFSSAGFKVFGCMTDMQLEKMEDWR